MSQWIKEEFASLDLGDQRLANRFVKFINCLMQKPTASIQAAVSGWKEAVGAYRFLNNAKATVQAILAPHQEACLIRVKEHNRVLMIQDTTELDYTPKKALKGTGPLSCVERQGFFSHNKLIISDDRLPLGIWNPDIYSRDEAEHGKAKHCKTKPIEEKESFRWLEGYREGCELAQQAPKTQVIVCGDRESDIYEIFEEREQRKAAGKLTADWLIRCKENRRLVKESLPKSDQNSSQSPSEWPKIYQAIEKTPKLGTISFPMKKALQSKKIKGGSKIKVTRKARMVTQEIRATQIELYPPRRNGKKLHPVKISVIQAKEINPPEDQEPIEWILLTSLKSETFEQAQDIINLYMARWEIEVFHRVLKTGCRVEELQLKADDRIKLAIATYMIVAWRVLYLMKLGRSCPDLPCDAVFDPDEWQSVWVIAHGHEALAKKPSLGELLTKVAEFGGYPNRKNDGPPGPQSIWQGMTRVFDFALAWQVFGKANSPIAL